MSESKPRSTPAETEQRLRRGSGEDSVVLEDGDPLEEAADAAEWDWDADVPVSCAWLAARSLLRLSTCPSPSIRSVVWSY